MEDGHPLNMALWLDPSVHYVPPLERIESIEVLRGTVITHGPNNNFGVVNLRNCRHSDPTRRSLSSAIGWTLKQRGCFGEDDERLHTCKDDTTDTSYRWHVHTRQIVGNVGVVLSYRGADVNGAWDTEGLKLQRLLRRHRLEAASTRT